MTMQRYRSEHPNQVHQLVVAVSKHYYAGKDGLLKYQGKPFDVSLAKLPKTARHHMLTYVLRDHCTGVFYAEICFAPEVMPLKQFLSRAWGEKPDYPFCGLPEMLSFPANLREAFPGVAEDVEQLGIGVYQPRSGFEAGATRDIRTIERGFLLFAIDKPAADASQSIQRANVYEAKQKSGRIKTMAKLEAWQRYVPEIRLPPVEWAD